MEDGDNKNLHTGNWIKTSILFGIFFLHNMINPNVFSVIDGLKLNKRPTSVETPRPCLIHRQMSHAWNGEMYQHSWTK